MSRVVPYPPPEELAHRSYGVALVTGGVSAEASPKPGAADRKLRRKLRRIVEGAGATLAKPDAADAGAEPSPADRAATPIDYRLRHTIETRQDPAVWEPPFKFLWETPEEVAERDGTCVHRVQIEAEIEVVDQKPPPRVRESYRLTHSGVKKIDGLDPACPLTEGERELLVEQVLEEALSCIRPPLEALLAPRGHVLAHRRSRETDQHLFLTSLGRAQGMEPADRVEIRREQHASTPTGEAWRSERVLTDGVLTDRVEDQESWVALDPSRVDGEILQGDLVRPLAEQSLLSSLSGPSCGQILETR